jgi:two-component system nitrogen regulation response regulator NtrX
MSERKPVILYVDDDPDYREMVRAILESDGYGMVEAETGEEGVQVFRDHAPDLVIVDLMMEEVDSGTRFVKELRLLGDTVPIYMLSSVGENLSQTVDTSALGLAGVFQKPIDRDTLLGVLRIKLSV